MIKVTNTTSAEISNSTKSATSKESKPFKETLQRGTVVFPIQYNLCNTVSPFYDLPIHWHDEFEIIHIISGSYSIFINDHEVTLNKDDICLIPGKVLHGDGQDKGKCLYESVVFDIDMLRQHSYSPDLFISNILNNTIYVDNVIPKDKENIHEIMSKFFDTIKVHSEGYELVSSGYLLIFFGMLKKEHLYTEKKILSTHKRTRAKQIDSILNLIRKNYNQELTLEQMAEVSGLSPKYFCRLFKEITSHSPIEYLNWFRVNRACSLLRETNEKLSDIAYECGFNDFSYFIKIFRRYKGMTPLKYRSFESPEDNPDEENENFLGRAIDASNKEKEENTTQEK